MVQITKKKDVPSHPSKCGDNVRKEGKKMRFSKSIWRTAITQTTIDKAKSMGVKIFSFAAGNYAEGVANLKTLAYRTGGEFYGMSYYLHFAS